MSKDQKWKIENTHQDHEGQGSHASSQDDERKLCGLHPAHCIYYFVFCNLLLSLFFHWIHHLISLFFKCKTSYFIIFMAWGLKLRPQVFTAPFTKNDIRGEIYLYLLMSWNLLPFHLENINKISNKWQVTQSVHNHFWPKWKTQKKNRMKKKEIPTNGRWH